MTRRYLIVGAGPAGVAAAGAIKSRDASGHVTIITDDPHGLYSRPGLAYYLSGEIGNDQLSLPYAGEFELLRVGAAAIDTDGHSVRLANGKSRQYDRLLLATGSEATKLTVPGADLEGVFKLDNMEDARWLVKQARRKGAAVVTGGGITALEIVEALAVRGVETHYVFRGARYWHNVLDESESAIVEKAMVAEGVHIHRSAQVAQVTGERGKVCGVATEQGLQIRCTLVGVAIGVRPRLELATSASLKTDRGIITDEYLQTSAADVFAAGDSAQVRDPVSGKSGVEMLWGKAVAQGRTAGDNMAGAHRPYRQAVPFNVTRLAGLTTTIIGAVAGGSDQEISTFRGESERWRLPPGMIDVQRDFGFNRTRIALGARTILGALVMGDQTLSRPLHELIAGAVDITPVRDALLAPEAPVADIITAFWLSRRRSGGE